MSTRAQDLRKEIDNLGDEPIPFWEPEPGDTLVGELVGVDTRSTAYDAAVPVLTVRTEGGGLVEVWALHKVLKGELLKHEPQPGEWLAVRRLQDSSRGYKRYRVVPDRDRPAEFNWSGVSADGGDVDPKDHAELSQEEESRKVLGTGKSSLPAWSADDDLPFSTGV